MPLPRCPKRSYARRLWCAILCGGALPWACAGSPEQGVNFANLSLEELSEIRVTSVSKRPERLADTAASVFVISAEDIRRAGAPSLPEALRLAPNLQVAQVDARNYAVTARGFANPFENKLLVLIDGRTVYSPLFSGIYWDAQDVVLEDLDRIEVISGPGATLWGANAVNGVINIITRSAAASTGLLVTAEAERGLHSASTRYGAALAGGGHYRIYAKQLDNDDTFSAAGVNSFTGATRRQAGFRLDAGAATVQGDLVDARLHQAGTRDILVGGANLLGRLERTLDDGSSLRLQAYADHTRRDQPNAFAEHLNTLDVELQHTLAPGAAQQLVWGGGYRKAYDRIVNGAAFGFLPAVRDLAWSNLFAQDELRLSEALRLTGGLKLERNSYTGNELLPHLLLAWQAAPGQLLWSSLARAVRVPSRIDHDLYSPTNPPVVAGVARYGIAGGPDFVSEVAEVAQVGYRGQLAPHLSFALTLYGNRFARLRTIEPNPFGAGKVFLNRAGGSARGAELSARWDVARSWRLTGGFSAQRLILRADPGSNDTAGASALANNDPSNWWQVRASVDLSEVLEFDAGLRHVGALSKPSVPAYNALDARLGWKLGRALECSLALRNALADGHAEWGPPATRNVYQRSLAGRLTWRY
ncbi:MAG: TonB-dependent receptor [Pseudomonadota bacterium]